VLLIAALNAFACPGCTHERLLAEYWYIKYVGISLLVPLLVVSNRLDPVRFAFVLIPYVVFSYEFHYYLFWHTFPGDAWLARIGWMTWSFNLVGVAMLYGVSHFRFFRWHKDKGLAGWQPMAYAVAMVIAQAIIS
jgi:hypothetical protein